MRNHLHNIQITINSSLIAVLKWGGGTQVDGVLFHFFIGFSVPLHLNKGHCKIYL